MGSYMIWVITFKDVVSSVHFVEMMKNENEAYSFDCCLDGIDSTYLKVIGNIYENPELLNRQGVEE